METETRRQKEIRILQSRETGWTLQELVDTLEVHRRIILEDMNHLNQSLRGSGLQLEICPVQCKKCSWKSDGKKIRAPGKCPKCNSEHLDKARYRIAPEA